MNAVFTVVFLISNAVFLLFFPEKFLPALLSGGQKAATLCLTLLAVYAVWLGFSFVAEACGVNRFLSKILKPSVKKLFRISDEEGAEYVCTNLSANMLGLSGIATPYGIKAVNRLKNLPSATFSLSMLLVVNATSVQLLPTTVLSLLTSFGAENAYSIVLPSLLATAFTTGMGILLCHIFIKKG